MVSRVAACSSAAYRSKYDFCSGVCTMIGIDCSPDAISGMPAARTAEAVASKLMSVSERMLKCCCVFDRSSC